jgi:citrate lyase subunit beta/citryl-CoA lyase
MLDRGWGDRPYYLLMRLLRSMLYVPGNRQEMCRKAVQLPADAVVLDLEDGVPPAEKQTACRLVKSYLSELAQTGRRAFVRLNPLSSGLTQAELEELVRPGLDGVSLPKINSANEVQIIASWVSALEKEWGMELGQVKLIPWVETALGVLNAYNIACASPRIVGLALGGDDLTRDMGIVRSDDGMELLYPRAHVALAAIAVGVAPLDTPYTGFRDEAGLVREARLARQLGFQGKVVIHPSQIEPVNGIFSPSFEEVAEARRLVAVFDEALSRGSAVTTVEGKMVDTPVAERARRLLALADAIAKKSGE